MLLEGLMTSEDFESLPIEGFTPAISHEAINLMGFYGHWVREDADPIEDELEFNRKVATFARCWAIANAVMAHEKNRGNGFHIGDIAARAHAGLPITEAHRRFLTYGSSH